MPSIYETDEAILRTLQKSDLIGLDSRIHKIHKHDLKNVANDHRLGALLATLTKVHAWVVNEFRRRGLPHVDGGPPLPKTEKVQNDFGEFVRQANIGSLPAVRVSEEALNRLTQGGASYLILPDIIESRELMDGPMPKAVVINNRSAVGTVRFLGLELPTSARVQFGIRTVERADDWKAAGIAYIPFIDPVTVKIPNGSKGVMRAATFEASGTPLEKQSSEFETREHYDAALAHVEALRIFTHFKDILDLPTVDIVPATLKPMREEELREIDQLLHDRFRVFDERGLDTDEFVAAHVFVIAEMKERKLPHPQTADGLDQITPKATTPVDSRDQKAMFMLGEHWVPVPESGTCPASHPNRLDLLGDENRCYTDSAAAALRASSGKVSAEEVARDAAAAQATEKKTGIQTIVFSKEQWDVTSARKWLSENDFISDGKVDEPESGNTIRFRQFSPDKCSGDFSVLTQDLPKGIQLTSCELKPGAEKIDSFKVFAKFVHHEEEIVTTKGKQEKRRLIYGVVYEPFVVDAQNDWANDVDIEAAAHQYLLDSRNMKLMHRFNTDKVKPVESYIAPQDFQLGTKLVKKGSWVLVSKVFDDAIWAKVESGEFAGYSLGGRSSIREGAPPRV